MLNGIVVLNKPRGMTSSDCVYKLRKILHIRKIGHAGTLDPEVNGVLPIAIGQATKLIELMHEKPKSYIGEGMLGSRTDSYDMEGHVLESLELEREYSDIEIKEAMQNLTGKLKQVPPIYSAVRVNGNRLYEYARENITVELPERDVQVYDYQLTQKPRFDDKDKVEYFDFAIQCSKGTYVRSLVNDLGTKLQVPAVMTSLTRISSSGYNITHAVTVEEIEAQLDTPEKWLQSIESFFEELEKINLTAEQFNRVKNGASVKLSTAADKVALFYQGKLKAIYKRVAGEYKADLMLLQNN